MFYDHPVAVNWKKLLLQPMINCHKLQTSCSKLNSVNVKFCFFVICLYIFVIENNVG